MPKTRISSLLLLILGACGSGDSAVLCDDGSVCPEPNFCNADGMCVAPPPDGFCVGQDDGTSCDEGNGACQGGECVAFVCGDGVVDSNEVCDGPAADGNCTDDGYDYGTPTCVGCSARGTGRCGILGWRQITGGDVPQNGRAVFASGSEIWVSAINMGYHYNGVVWSPRVELRGTSLHGTGPDDLWVFDSGIVRHVTPAGATEETFGATQGSIAAVSADEVYLAGRRSSDNQAAIWKYDASGWSELHAVDGAPYRSIVVAGDSVVAARNGSITVIDSQGPRDIAVPEMAASVGGMWARSKDDVYIRGNGDIFHFDGQTVSSRFANDGVPAGLGGSTYILRGGLPDAPGTMREHRTGTPLTELRRLKGLGFNVNGFPEFSTFVTAVHSGEDRMIAVLNLNGGVHEFDGAGFSDINIAGGPRDLSRRGDQLFWTRTIPNSTDRAIGIVENAYGAAPSITEVEPFTQPLSEIWGRSATDVFVTAGPELLRWTGTGTTLTPVLTASGTLFDIAGATADSALAVGGNGEAYLFDGATWEPVGGGVVGTAGLTAVFAASDGFVVVGTGGRIFVRRGDGWLSVPSGVTRNLTAVDGASTSDFYAAGRAGVLLHCREDNSVFTCVSEGPETALNFNGLAFTSATDIVATAGDDGLHYDGIRWSNVTFEVSGTVGHLVGVGEYLWLGATNADFSIRRVERARSWVAVP